LTLRITREEGSLKTVVRVEGRLAAEGIEELRKACFKPVGGLTLDLSFLQAADLDGIRALNDLQASGAALRGADVYMQLLLDRKEGETIR
jgi:hypothetical protein